MTRSSVVTIAAFLLASCGTSPEAGRQADIAQSPEAVRTAEPAYAVGIVQRTYLDDPEWPEFKAGYDSSRIESQYLDMLRAVYQGEEFLVFFGAWCGDSKRDLPRFLKIADRIEIPPAKVTLYSLDRTKKSPDGLTDQYGIQFVPTFIVMKDGAEVGRITEYPQVSVEADLLTILAAARAK